MVRIYSDDVLDLTVIVGENPSSPSSPSKTSMVFSCLTLFVSVHSKTVVVSLPDFVMLFIVHGAPLRAPIPTKVWLT